jgi:hypothetical protein
MAPKTPAADVPSPEGLDDEVEPVITEENNPLTQKRPPMIIVWRNVIVMGTLHLLAVYSLFKISSAHPLTWLWSKIFFFCSLF